MDATLHSGTILSHKIGTRFASRQERTSHTRPAIVACTRDSVQAKNTASGLIARGALCLTLILLPLWHIACSNDTSTDTKPATQKKEKTEMPSPARNIAAITANRNNVRRMAPPPAPPASSIRPFISESNEGGAAAEEEDESLLDTLDPPQYAVSRTMPSPAMPAGLQAPRLTKDGKIDRRYIGFRDAPPSQVINPEYTKPQSGPTINGIHFTLDGKVDRRFVSNRDVSDVDALAIWSEHLYKTYGKRRV